MQLFIRIISVIFSWVLLFTSGDSQITLDRQVIWGNGHIDEYHIQLSEDVQDLALLAVKLSFRGNAPRQLIIDESLDNEIVLTGDYNVLDSIEVEYDYDLEEITINGPNTVFRPTLLTIAVGAPVRELFVNGAWDFSYNCPGMAGDCRIDINGAAKGDFTFGQMENLRITLNGASQIALYGAAQNATLTLNGSSLIEAFGLVARHAEINMNGASSCEIAAQESLRLTVNGVGVITYDGDPVIQRIVNGLASVQKRADDAPAEDQRDQSMGTTAPVIEERELHSDEHENGLAM